MSGQPCTYAVTDMHAAGEPVRIITGGAPELTGETLLEKRRSAMNDHDAVRRHLMREPRGHADMYGVWPTAPDHPDYALAVLFLHNGGYSTMCGHATVALGRWMIDTGQVPVETPVTRFTLQCPCGPVRVAVEIDPDGRPGEVSFESVPAFAADLDMPLSLPDGHQTRIDLAYGGAYYAILPASRLGLDLMASPYPDLIEAGRAITRAGREQLTITHPGDPDLGFLYGTILTDDGGPPAEAVSRNLCIFGGGQVDRSATGSGITARLALAHARGETTIGQPHAFAGLSGVPFTGTVSSVTDEGIRVSVAGRGYYSGKSEWTVESDDPLADGFEVPARLADQSGLRMT